MENGSSKKESVMKEYSDQNGKKQMKNNVCNIVLLLNCFCASKIKCLFFPKKQQSFMIVFSKVSSPNLLTKRDINFNFYVYKQSNEDKLKKAIFFGFLVFSK